MISVKHLTKCYGEFTAVDDLSFEIDEGHVYGFLGPNGAGKSTTMNIITGCLSATSGQVTIDGHDIFEEPKEAKRAIGYLPEIPPLYTNETPEEYLKFVAEAKGLKGKEMDCQIEGVISQTRIQNVRKRLISKLSKGGGLSVVVDEARVFIPASLVSDTYEKDLSKYQDQEIEFVISEFNPRRNRVIGDRRQLLVAEKAEKQKELFEKLHVGDTVEGVVKNVTDFGAFIDLGGVDGLLHISEMSWGRVENPKKVFKVGDELKVLVKDIHDTKIALSLKFPESNPWANAAEDYAVGTVITGKVARMTDFGAFVELAPGVDALLHVSQISKAHVDKPSDVLKVGEEVTAKIVDLNEAEKKISLSMKALEAADEETADAE